MPHRLQASLWTVSCEHSSWVGNGLWASLQPWPWLGHCAQKEQIWGDVRKHCSEITADKKDIKMGEMKLSTAETQSGGQLVAGFQQE